MDANNPGLEIGMLNAEAGHDTPCCFVGADTSKFLNIIHQSSLTRYRWIEDLKLSNIITNCNCGNFSARL
ncbi:MAG: hypothetical protein ACTSWN_00755 [Promethearchaeota archaeon]